MAVLTDAALTTEANVIKNETANLANTATRVGQMFIDIIDSKRLPKVYAALVANASGTFTVTELQNDFGATTFAFTIPSTGVVRVTASGATFTANKSGALGSAINSGGTPHFMIGFAASTTIFTFNIFLHDGTQLTNPNFTDVLFKIEVYP